MKKKSARVKLEMARNKIKIINDNKLKLSDKEKRMAEAKKNQAEAMKFTMTFKKNFQKFFLDTGYANIIKEAPEGVEEEWNFWANGFNPEDKKDQDRLAYMAQEIGANVQNLGLRNYEGMGLRKKNKKIITQHV